MDNEEVSSKSVFEVDDKRGERGGWGGGEGVVRAMSGVSEASEGVVAPRVRGQSEGEERRGNMISEGEDGEGAGQPFVLAVSVGPEGKGGPKRFGLNYCNAKADLN